MLRDGKPSTLALELPRGNDGALHLRLWIQPLLGPDGRIQRLLGQVQNITEQHQTDALIRWRTELLNRVSALGRIGGCEIDVATRHMQWTEECYRIHGLRKEPISLDQALALYTQDSRDAFEAALARIAAGGLPEQLDLCFYRQSGLRIWVQVLIELDHRDGLPTRFVVLFRDITREREANERIELLAHYDLLTGLPNRMLLREQTADAIEEARDRGAPLAMLFIDLDGFKAVNDLHGHAAGDEVLRLLGQRFKALDDEHVHLARLSGDEFAAVLRMHSVEELSLFAEKLQDVINQPMPTSFGLFNLGASLGGAVYPQDGHTKESLLGNADLAMYRAKRELGQQVCFYEPAMDERVRLRQSLASELRAAIEHDQLQVHYQQQIDIATGRVRGYEALLRWQHPTRGSIPPSEFIPLAERDTTILLLGEWVLRKACQDAARWMHPCSVAVNLSPMQFIHDDLPSLVRRILDETGLAPARLELELTESSIFADRDKALAMLTRIKALGVSIALDDFGTGYSSLDILRSFPFDKIKTDRSFMPSIEENPQARAIISAVLALGRSLDIPVLAEGIETPGQLELLRDMGCAAVQGYFLGRPKPLTALVEAGQIALLHDGLPA